MWIFLLIIVILLLPYIVLSICSTLIYFYETVNNPCKELDTPRPTLLFALGMFARTLACAIAAVIWRPLGWLPRKKPSPWNPDSSLPRPPVVLVHGLYHNSSAWVFLGNRLERAGYVVLPFSYSSFFTTFDDIVARFNDHLYLLEASYPGQKPILVGHSMGGLIIRAWLKDKDNKKRAGGIVTMGTPHKGSKLAALGPGSMSKNLLPGSDLLAELNKDKTPAKIPCVAFCSNADELVLPPENLLPPKGWKMRLVENTSHFGLLVRRNMAHELIEVLRRMDQPDNPVAAAAPEGPAPAGKNDGPAQDKALETPSLAKQPRPEKRISDDERLEKPAPAAAGKKAVKSAAAADPKADPKADAETDAKASSRARSGAAAKKALPRKSAKAKNE